MRGTQHKESSYPEEYEHFGTKTTRPQGVEEEAEGGIWVLGLPKHSALFNTNVGSPVAHVAVESVTYGQCPVPFAGGACHGEGDAISRAVEHWEAYLDSWRKGKESWRRHWSPHF